MISHFTRLIFILALNFMASIPIYATTIEQNDVNFPLKTEALLSGEMHYFSTLLTPRQMLVKYPEIFDLDALNLLQEPNVEMYLTKSVMVVNRPVGFFEEHQITNENYQKHVAGQQKIKRLANDTFEVTVPGETGYRYKEQFYFDADDLSTLPNSKIIRAVSAAKKLDVISQGASSIMFSEKTQYSKYSEGGVSVSSFIPLKENKSLIITYQLWAMKKPYALKNVLKKSFLSELMAQKKLIENYP